MKNFLLTAALAFIGSLVFSQERIAVFPFEDMENVLTRNEAVMFYREFSNEFTNKSAGKFSVVPRQEVEKLINTEAAFQMSDFSSQAKTAEMQRVLNGTQILSGLIGKLGNNIRITVSLYTYPELAQLPGGTTLSVVNKDELFRKIPELVQQMQNRITEGSTNSGGMSAANSTTAPIPGFVRVEGGTFQMGSNNGWDDQMPAHTVTVKSFNMAKYEVTQKEWTAIMGSNPSWFKGDNLPVECVSWYDVIEYCNRLSEKEKLKPAYTIDKSRKGRDNESEVDDQKWSVTWNQNANGYRLPTEAEWEYAARGGSGLPGNYTFAGSNNVDDVAWYWDNSAGSTQEVGVKKPNGLGLYDMSGNVMEWCWDWYGTYRTANQTDPIGAYSGSYRVVRGGSWLISALYVSSAYRSGNTPSNRHINQGFRVVRNG